MIPQRAPLERAPPPPQAPRLVNYVRSALTYGAVFCLIGLLLLFFGGLFLGGASRLPEPGAGWAGVHPRRGPFQGGLLFVALAAGLGMLMALRVQASWGETAAVLVLLAGGVWAFGPAGADEAWQVLWRVGWVWEGLLGGGANPGWGV